MKNGPIIELLFQIVKNSEDIAKKIIEEVKDFNFIEEIIIKERESNNILYNSDNIKAIKDLLEKGYKNKIDLIYIDPPFLTMANYKSRIVVLNVDKKEVINSFAYNDVWKEGLKEYLEMLTIRIFLMKELLSDKGTIYVHLDFRTVHYVKIIMDYIFQEGKFLNEVIWAYKSGGSTKNYFSRKHDNILVYTKTQDYIFNPQKEKSYNRGFKPYGFKNVVEYKDEVGWYTLVNLKDVWNIDMVGRTSKERVGYDTQKPERLLELIISSSSKEGSIVADFFGGSGTTAIVAQKLNRQWILADKGHTSMVTIRKRLGENTSQSYTLLREEEVYKGSLSFKQVNLQELDLEKYKIKVHLEEYHLKLDEIKMSKKHLDLSKSIMKKESLNFIDYIALVYKTSNNIIILEEHYRNPSKLKIESNIEFTIGKDFIEKELYLKVIDIFGNESYKALEID